MKKQHLLKSMLLLCALVVGSTSVWADALTTADFAWPLPMVNEDFSSTTVGQETDKHNPTITNYTKMGVFNGIYCNKDDKSAKYGIEATVFGSNAMFLTPNGGSPIVSSITTETYSEIGAFSFKTTKATKGYIGIYKQINGTAITHSDAAVYLYLNAGQLQISKGSSWVTIGTWTTTNIDVCVIYNSTNSATTYGASVALPAKRAHIYVNGTCVMDGANPKAFEIAQTASSAMKAFRVVAANSTTVNIDDVKIYDKVPAASVGGTITASGWNTFSSAYDLDLSTITGGTAYVATAASTGKVTLEPTTAKVPAGTGLMIKGDATDDFTISTTTAATSTPAVNKLVGLPSGGKVEKNDNNYVFGWEDPSSPGFYLINSTEPTLAAGKAYLHTDAALSQFLSVDFEEGGATSIEAIESHKAQTSSAYFNLAGQRVAQPTKGLYIVNGKKVIIK